MTKKFRNRSFCMLEPDLIESEAFLSLSSVAAMKVLIRFHQKAHRKRTKGKSKNLGKMVITNNGDIVFTYAEALELGIPKATFVRALKELVETKGFIDIAEPGNWFLKQPTKFAISQRWKRYGTPDYETVKMPRMLPKGKGWQLGNKCNPRCHG